MAHARRKFWDVHEATKSPLAREALDRIAALYEIENTIRGRPPDQRLRARIEHTAPLMIHYNFVRIHQTLRCTPAMAAGVTTTLWDIADMVKVLENWEN